MNNESDIKLNVGFLSVRPEVRIKILPFVQTLGGVKDIILSELNVSNPDLSEYDVVFVSWNIKNKLFLDDLNKIRSVWANRTQVFVGVGDVSDIDKQIAFEFGVGSWLSVENIETEIAKLKIDLHNYKENNEIYSDLEKKAVLALEDKDITEFKTIMDSLLFIDARNSIFIEFLGEILFEKQLFAEAYDMYERVLINQPNAIRILARTAESLGKLELHDKARKYYERAENAARNLLGDIFLASSKRGYKGGPDILNSAISQLNSPERVAEYVSNRLLNLAHVEGDEAAKRYLKNTQKTFNLRVVHELNYSDILAKKFKGKDSTTQVYEKTNKSQTKAGEALNYDEIITADKKKNRFKKSS